MLAYAVRPPVVPDCNVKASHAIRRPGNTQVFLALINHVFEFLATRKKSRHFVCLPCAGCVMKNNIKIAEKIINRSTGGVTGWEGRNSAIRGSFFSLFNAKQQCNQARVDSSHLSWSDRTAHRHLYIHSSSKLRIIHVPREGYCWLGARDPWSLRRLILAAGVG